LRRLMDDMLETIVCRARHRAWRRRQVGRALRGHRPSTSPATEGKEKQPLAHGQSRDFVALGGASRPYNEGCLSLPEHYADVDAFRPRSSCAISTTRTRSARMAARRGCSRPSSSTEMDHLQGRASFVDHISPLESAISSCGKLAKSKASRRTRAGLTRRPDRTGAAMRSAPRLHGNAPISAGIGRALAALLGRRSRLSPLSIASPPRPRRARPTARATIAGPRLRPSHTTSWVRHPRQACAMPRCRPSSAALGARRRGSVRRLWAHPARRRSSPAPRLRLQSNIHASLAAALGRGGGGRSSARSSPATRRPGVTIHADDTGLDSGAILLAEKRGDWAPADHRDARCTKNSRPSSAEKLNPHCARRSRPPARLGRAATSRPRGRQPMPSSLRRDEGPSGLGAAPPPSSNGRCARGWKPVGLGPGPRGSAGRAHQDPRPAAIDPGRRGGKSAPRGTVLDAALTIALRPQTALAAACPCSAPARPGRPITAAFLRGFPIAPGQIPAMAPLQADHRI